MKTVLVISSYVAASRVGSVASAYCLRRLGHEVIILPTTLMGRHPGWGDPGGGAVPVDQLNNMLKAIQAQNIKFDAVLTGYMGEFAHIGLTAEVITELTHQNEALTVLVDPVMGDDGRLYIPKDRAQAICETLVPLASVITPNLWELSYIRDNGFEVDCNTLTTSVPAGHNIGARYEDQNNRASVEHRKFDSVPHGGGDALAGLFLGHLLNDLDPVMAMSKAVAGVFRMMEAANALDAGELPLIRTQSEWVNPLPLKAKRTKHD